MTEVNIPAQNVDIEKLQFNSLAEASRTRASAGSYLADVFFLRITVQAPICNMLADIATLLRMILPLNLFLFQVRGDQN